MLLIQEKNESEIINSSKSGSIIYLDQGNTTCLLLKQLWGNVQFQN